MTARRLADDLVPVIDGHNDIAWALRQLTSDAAATPDITSHPSTQTDIRRLRLGGVAAQFFSVYVPDDQDPYQSAFTTLQQVALVRRLVAHSPDVFEFAGCRGDIERIMGNKKIAVMLGAEGAHSVGYSPELLGIFRSLNVLYMTLTHVHSSAIADSSTDVSDIAGLSALGHEFVQEMNRVGMLIDISHVSQQTAADVLAQSHYPVVYSHSSCYGLTPHVRNANDANLAALARNDGVIMISFVAPFVSPDRSTNGAYPHQAPTTDRGTTYSQTIHPDGAEKVASLVDVANHIDYAREAAGLSHVGIGSDFDGTTRLPRGLEDVSKYQALLGELRRRRWSDTEIRKVAYQNTLRVIGDVCG